MHRLSAATRPKSASFCSLTLLKLRVFQLIIILCPIGIMVRFIVMKCHPASVLSQAPLAALIEELTVLHNGACDYSMHWVSGPALADERHIASALLELQRSAGPWDCHH